jgi:hypothetical protein
MYATRSDYYALEVSILLPPGLIPNTADVNLLSESTEMVRSSMPGRKVTKLGSSIVRPRLSFPPLLSSLMLSLRSLSPILSSDGCAPNLEAQKFTTLGDAVEEYEVGFFAQRDIKAGEELYYDYNVSYLLQLVKWSPP